MASMASCDEAGVLVVVKLRGMVRMPVGYVNCWPSDQKMFLAIELATYAIEELGFWSWPRFYPK